MLPPLTTRLLVHSSLFLDPAMTGPFPGSVAAGTLPKVGVAAAVIFGVRGPWSERSRFGQRIEYVQKGKQPRYFSHLISFTLPRLSPKWCYRITGIRGLSLIGIRTPPSGRLMAIQ